MLQQIFHQKKSFQIIPKIIEQAITSQREAEKPRNRETEKFFHL